MGMKSNRIVKKHRYYRDKGIITLHNVMTGSNNGVTLEESVNNAVKLKSYSNESNIINNSRVTDNSDMKELKEMNQKQKEF